MTASIGLASSHWSSSFGIRIWITIFRHTRIEWLNFWSLSSAARAVESLVRVSFPIFLDMFVVLLLDSTPNPDAVKIYNGNPKHITYGSSATLKGQYGDSSFIYLLKWIFYWSIYWWIMMLALALYTLGDADCIPFSSRSSYYACALYIAYTWCKWPITYIGWVMKNVEKNAFPQLLLGWEIISSGSQSCWRSLRTTTRSLIVVVAGSIN